MCHKRGLEVSKRTGGPKKVYGGSNQFFRFPGKEKFEEVLRQRELRRKNGEIRREALKGG